MSIHGRTRTYIQSTLLLVFYLSILQTGFSQEVLPLWPKGKMPNSKGLALKDSISNERIIRIINPEMHVFLPSKDDNNGAAVLIFPGGGYHHLTYNLGGFQLAKWFNTMGIAAFVVNYRLPTSADLIQREIAPLQDAQRAMKIVRANAVKWNIDPSRIGVQGSSAGGHVAAMISTSTSDISVIKDNLDTVSYQPNFMILVSPVISMGEFAHKASRVNLLGDNPSTNMISQYSLELQVKPSTPPTFIADAFNDKSVHPMNSLLFYKSLLEKNISSSLHAFPQGGHAIGMNNNPGSTGLWKTLCEEWLKEISIIKWPVKK